MWALEEMAGTTGLDSRLQRDGQTIKIGYDHASVATHTEAEEIVAEAKDFLALVERWIAANHPGFTP